MIINTDNFCKGVGNICIDGTSVGALKDGSRVTLTPVTDSDSEIRCAQHGGAVLDKRQGEVVYDLTCEAMEVDLRLLARALGNAALVSGGSLHLGSRSKVAEVYQVQFFGEGPGQINRRWTFHKAFLDNPGELLLGHQQDFCSVTLKFRVCLDETKTSDWWYGIINDYV